MNKHKLIAIGGILGFATAVGYRTYAAIKRAKAEQEVIDVTPVTEEESDTTRK